jgi:hypothetical protein
LKKRVLYFYLKFMTDINFSYIKMTSTLLNRDNI